MTGVARLAFLGTPEIAVPPLRALVDAGHDVALCVYLISTLIVGVASQAMANEPDLEWGQGRYSPLFAKLMRLLVAVYPPPEST